MREFNIAVIGRHKTNDSVVLVLIAGLALMFENLSSSSPFKRIKHWMSSNYFHLPYYEERKASV
ncbi:MAG: hypothetical protein VYE27_05410 [Pseudomonadota bacterium]|nr:hypothetical protein [Pseudomonadota bacterium]